MCHGGDSFTCVISTWCAAVFGQNQRGLCHVKKEPLLPCCLFRRLPPVCAFSSLVSRSFTELNSDTFDDAFQIIIFVKTFTELFLYVSLGMEGVEPF